MQRKTACDQPETVPYRLAVLQIDAYRYAFIEAVRRANEAIRQRDYYRKLALSGACEISCASGECGDEFEACPLAFGSYCKYVLDKVDKGACFL